MRKMKKPPGGIRRLSPSREAHAVVNYMVRLSAFLFKSETRNVRDTPVR